MVATSTLILAASSILPLAFAAPITRSTPRSLMERGAYTVFGGNGSPDLGWPAKDSWKSFDDLWTANLPTIKVSCAQFNQAENTDDEISTIHDALQSTAKDTGLPAEFLLAIMMQESKGCVRVPTTSYGNVNPGLFQSFNGASSCNNGGSVSNPCPADTIAGMIKEGAGVGLQFGLTQAITQSGASDVSQFYKAARIYNSGSIDPSGNLGQGVATHCYASDVANRLTGWTTETSGCQEGTIGSLQGTQTTTTDDSNTQPTTSDPTAPKAAGAASNCKSWYVVKAGDTCTSTGVSLDTLRKLNTSLDGNCSNLWAGSAYCTAA